MRCGFCYAQKYVNELPDPTEDGAVKEHFLIGQAFDDLMTHGDDKFKELYTVVARRMGKSANVELTEGQGELLKQMKHEFEENILFAKQPKKHVFTWQEAGLNLRSELDDLDLANKMMKDLKTCASVITFEPQNYLDQMTFYQFIIEMNEGVRCGALLEAVDKYTYFSRSQPVEYLPETLFANRGRLLTALGDLKTAHDTGIFEPSKDQKTLYACPYYGLKTNRYPNGHGRPTQALIF